MALSSEDKQKILQVFLAIVIIGLGYLLYHSITAPYADIAEQERLTEETRDRMDNVRSALIHYEQRQERFPHTLDTLGTYIDTAMMDIADQHFTEGFNRDSLFYSPRTGERFEYTVNDTGAVRIYFLQDPASGDFIGSEEPDITQRNAASWE